MKNEERRILYNKMMKDNNYDEIDKDFIIFEQHKIIDQLKITNEFNENMAKHFRELYLWPEKGKQF